MRRGKPMWSAPQTPRASAEKKVPKEKTSVLGTVTLGGGIHTHIRRVRKGKKAK